MRSSPTQRCPAIARSEHEQPLFDRLLRHPGLRAQGDDQIDDELLQKGKAMEAGEIADDAKWQVIFCTGL